MKKELCIKINENDNVAVAIRDIHKGQEIIKGVIAKDIIPQAHKVALEDIKKNDEIVRYGVTLGYAIDDIVKGQWINEEMLRLPISPSLNNLTFGRDTENILPQALVKKWLGYKNPNGGYGGTRNILGINTTVQCVTGVVNKAIEKMKRELLPKYKNVDDIR